MEDQHRPRQFEVTAEEAATVKRTLKSPEQMVKSVRMSVAEHFKNVAAMNVAIIRHAPDFFTTDQLIKVQKINQALYNLAEDIAEKGGSRKEKK